MRSSVVRSRIARAARPPSDDREGQREGHDDHADGPREDHGRPDIDSVESGWQAGLCPEGLSAHSDLPDGLRGPRRASSAGQSEAHEGAVLVSPRATLLAALTLLNPYGSSDVFDDGHHSRPWDKPTRALTRAFARGLITNFTPCN